MSIEFIHDEFLEGKKEELDDIYKTLSQKPKVTDRKTLFLRRFTLALMGQYKVKKYLHEKHEEIEKINKIVVEETKKLFINEQIPMPPAPNRMYVPRPEINRNIPSPKVQVPVPNNITQLKIPEPMKNEIKIPEPISIGNSDSKKEIPKPL